MTPTRRLLWLYLGLVFLLSWPFEAFLISRGGLSAFGIVGPLVLMWIPGVVAIAMKLARSKEIGPLGWKLPRRWIWWALPYGLPLCVALLAYGTAWLTGLAPLEIPWARIAEKLTPGPLGLAMAVAISSTVAIATGAFFALGEEIGWRGLMVPLLVKSGLPRPLLLSGFIWGLWHAPMIVFGDYSTSNLPWLSAIIFMVVISVDGVTYGWTRVASASLWPAVLMHASHNAFFQSVFDRYTGKSALSSFMVGESGVLPAVAYGAFALWLWRSGRLTRAVGEFTTVK
jgi:uncharacterized protein